jgi:hypothetical protein
MPADPYQTLTPEQQRQTLDEVSRKLGIAPAIIEKDYWVCRTLDALFNLPELSDHLVFKGGTSLSKAYGLIERFSEDVDVSFHRDYLGFGEGEDPEAQAGNKAKDRKIEDLKAACVEKIASSLLPALRERLESELGTTAGWSLEIDPSDPQTILFHFPQAGVETYPYVKPSVRIELGARSDDWPREERPIRSFIGEALDQAIGIATAHTLQAERTFWEKATLLHAECHRDPTKAMPPRYARHYHDLARLARSEVAGRALANTALRERVVEHKKVYFRSGWSQYELAVPGTFKLVPPDSRLPELEKDHGEMRQMFFNEPPAIPEVLAVLKELEDRINSL